MLPGQNTVGALACLSRDGVDVLPERLGELPDESPDERARVVRPVPAAEARERKDVEPVVQVFAERALGITVRGRGGWRR